MFRAVIVFALLVASPLVAAGQGTRRPDQQPPTANDRGQGFKWWQADSTRSELGLTDDQSAKIEEIFQSVALRLQAAFADIDRGEKQMSKLLSANETTEVDVVRQLTQLQAAKNEADRQRTLMLFRIQRVLTADQRVKFKAMRERWQRERERARRGEPPPHPRSQARK